MKKTLQLIVSLMIVAMISGCGSSKEKIGENKMSVMVLLETQIKSKEISNMKSYLDEILPDTRAYDGCQSLDVYFNTEDTDNMVMVEFWDSRAHYEKYLNWRTETGVLDKVGAMFAEPPIIRYFDRTDL